LEKLERQMQAMGADLIFQRSVDRQTATARKIDKSESLSTIQLMLRNLENSIEHSYKLAGDWIGVDASGVRVSIGQDMGLPGNEANSVTDLVDLNERGKIDDATLISELKRRGVLAQAIEGLNEAAEYKRDNLDIDT